MSHRPRSLRASSAYAPCGSPGGVAGPGHLEQVRADGVEPVASREPLIGRQPVEQVEPGPGTADHSDGVVQRHHGIGRDPHQQLIQGGDLRPVGSAAVAASSYTAAIAAWSWYCPGGPT
jgi:hypothetical protein